jgi:hypothetical protein
VGDTGTLPALLILRTGLGLAVVLGLWVCQIEVNRAGEMGIDSVQCDHIGRPAPLPNPDAFDLVSARSASPAALRQPVRPNSHSIVGVWNTGSPVRRSMIETKATIEDP